MSNTTCAHLSHLHTAGLRPIAGKGLLECIEHASIGDDNSQFAVPIQRLGGDILRANKRLSTIDHHNFRVHVEFRVFTYTDAALLNCRDAFAVAITRGTAWRGQNHLNLDAALDCADEILLNLAIVHLLSRDQQRLFSAGNHRVKVATRIDRTNDQIGIMKVGGGAIPISLEDRLHCLHVLSVRIDNIIFAVFRRAAGS